MSMRKRSRLPSLCDAIVSDILSRAHARFVHKVGRFVSKSWGRIISTRQFIEMHLFHSNSNKPAFVYDLFCFFQFRNEKIFYEGYFMGLDSKQFLGCCNGLVLFRAIAQNKNERQLYVSNPITNQLLKLPPLLDDVLFIEDACISFLSNTREFKVLFNYIPPIINDDDDDNNLLLSWCVLTIGSHMSWRKLDHIISDLPMSSRKQSEYIDHDDISLTDEECYLFSVGDIAICSPTMMLDDENKFLAIDLNDESVHSVRGPTFDGRGGDLMPMGTHLYLASKILSGQITIWKLIDLKRSEWVEVFRNETIGWALVEEAVFCKAWLDNHKILIFKIQSKDKLIACDLKLKKISWIDAFDSRLWYHTTSLVSW